MPGLKPLTNLPLALMVDGVPVTGTILHLLPKDMQVEILSPYSGTSTGSHIPAFAGGPLYATYSDGVTTAITPPGQRIAEEHLRTLYQQALAGVLSQTTMLTMPCSACAEVLRMECGSFADGPADPVQTFTCPYCKQPCTLTLPGRVLWSSRMDGSHPHLHNHF